MENIPFCITKFFAEYGFVLLIIMLVIFLIIILINDELIKNYETIAIPLIIVTGFTILSANYLYNLEYEKNCNNYKLINYEEQSLYVDNQIKQIHLITYLKNKEETTDVIPNYLNNIKIYNVDNYKNQIQICEYESYEQSDDFLTKIKKVNYKKYKVFKWKWFFI